jgi:hypothetical protein
VSGRKKLLLIFGKISPKGLIFLTDIYFKYLPTIVLIGFVERGAFQYSFLSFKKWPRSWQKGYKYSFNVFLSLSSKYF